ncbi:DNA polymerase LigD [Alkalihalobacillus sp. BA299]|uniref:ATP-dependent DNA ligase n=1 Tax=Alkalihalobacillus sp. BA299 TaxID=2815938 RepID=UPI001AD986C9|nr:DNA polymerase LigD [Alkalihalobacillus sp. BA299]
MLNTPIKPMLLQPSTTIPKGEFLHQLKMDGHRTLLHYDHGKIKVFTRHMNDVTAKYPELQHIRLPVDTCILDGELICFDESDPPKPCFDSLTTRFQASNPNKIQSLLNTLPVSFSAFDIIFLNGQSLIDKNLAFRFNKLQSIITNEPYISLCPTFSDGEALFEKIVELGLEGVCSKSLSGFYRLNERPTSKSNDVWFKIKNYQYQIIQIGALRKGEFGWMMLQDGKYRGILEFVPPDERKAFYQVSKQLVKGEDKKYIYLEPRLQCKVKYQCLSKKGLMRSASFVEFIY